MHRVEWDASAANTKSIAVAKRLGMTRDGVIRQNYLYRGVRHDSEIWSVLARSGRPARALSPGARPALRGSHPGP